MMGLSSLFLSPPSPQLSGRQWLKPFGVLFEVPCWNFMDDSLFLLLVFSYYDLVGS